MNFFNNKTTKSKNKNKKTNKKKKLDMHEKWDYPARDTFGILQVQVKVHRYQGFSFSMNNKMLCEKGIISQAY